MLRPGVGNPADRDNDTDPNATNKSHSAGRRARGVGERLGISSVTSKNTFPHGSKRGSPLPLALPRVPPQRDPQVYAAISLGGDAREDRYDLGVIRQRVLSTSARTFYLRSPLNTAPRENEFRVEEHRSPLDDSLQKRVFNIYAAVVLSSCFGNRRLRNA
ncbi:hypothetical protein PUN28_014438 [Cardiocondyla obscurior]|uniref:Uncharacterized protein n=1 Tax=Cardiocondyla obscurior TaxID=286306 RepID=A0AAW2F033_9HYME